MTAITEYGVRRLHPVTGASTIQWPSPSTGLLALPGSTPRSDDLEAIRQAIATQPALEGATVVSRTYEIEEVASPEPALPTTPGSVVRAAWDGSDDGPGGDERALWALTDDDDYAPWRSIIGAHYWSGPEHLTDVEILFDAGSAP